MAYDRGTANLLISLKPGGLLVLLLIIYNWLAQHQQQHRQELLRLRSLLFFLLTRDSKSHFFFLPCRQLGSLCNRYLLACRNKTLKRCLLCFSAHYKLEWLCGVTARLSVAQGDEKCCLILMLFILLRISNKLVRWVGLVSRTLACSLCFGGAQRELNFSTGRL